MIKPWSEPVVLSCSVNQFSLATDYIQTENPGLILDWSVDDRDASLD